MFVSTIRAVSLLGVLFSADPSSAAWITLKNDTEKVLVVQETRSVNGKLTKGKSYRLAPGEVLKEFQAGAGTKSFLVSERDSATAAVAVKLTWGKDDVAYALVRRDDEVKLAAKGR